MSTLNYVRLREHNRSPHLSKLVGGRSSLKDRSTLYLTLHRVPVVSRLGSLPHYSARGQSRLVG